MKINIKLIYIFIALILLFTSCMPVKQALNNNHHNNTTTHTSYNNRYHNTKPYSNTTTSSNSAKTDDIYTSSLEYLTESSDNLTKYCESWIGRPHKLGGTTKQGVDCSGFVLNVYNDVYNISLPRSSAQMEKVVDLLPSKDKLKEGDLVFFGKQNVNHVGIYLKDNKFIHTSTSKGVIISSLQEKYWKENYKSCGHHPQLKIHKHN